MVSDPRHIALNALTSWHASPHTLDRSLEKHSNEISALTKKDKNLCNALIFGVLRHRNFLDHIISAFSNTPLKKIKPLPLYILRIALFQVIYMDRVPDFAAINTAVNIAKKQAGKKTAGYINAVLRAACTNWSKVDLPDKAKKPDAYLSINYSIPIWLAKKWINTFGFKDAETLCDQINTIPEITLRVNTLKTDRSSLLELMGNHVKTIETTPYADQGLCFTSPDMPIREMEEFNQGLFQIQDEAAQMVTQLLAPEPGERILDACAGLGGKTGHIAQMMKNKGTLTAVDVEAEKLNTLTLEAKRLGIDIVRTKSADLLKMSIKNFGDYFDRVLIDAPCTGLGVLRRNPDTKYKRTKKDIQRLAGKQKKMLNAAANLVKPGGILVFAVCSCEKEENEEVVEHFLNKRKDFSIDKDVQSDNYLKLITEDGFIKTYPAANNMDGFFAARLKRKPKQQ